jgi:hypothetical protein
MIDFIAYPNFRIAVLNSYGPVLTGCRSSSATAQVL